MREAVIGLDKQIKGPRSAERPKSRAGIHWRLVGAKIRFS